MVIIGAGPAGIGLASLLAQCGVASVVLERGRVGESFLSWCVMIATWAPSARARAWVWVWVWVSVYRCVGLGVVVGVGVDVGVGIGVGGICCCCLPRGGNSACCLCFFGGGNACILRPARPTNPSTRPADPSTAIQAQGDPLHLAVLYRQLLRLGRSQRHHP